MSLGLTFSLGVSPETAATLLNQERRRRHFRVRRYYANRKTLIVAIPTALHERLHLEIYGDHFYKVAMMNLRHDWVSAGASSHPHHLRGNCGEADSSGGPYPDRVGYSEWPTLVIEAGDTATLKQLRSDVEWWFSESHHEVQIVLLVKFDHHQDKIILETYEEAEPRRGAMTTRSSAKPVRRQEITITRDVTSDPPTYNISGGTLSLSFKRLFLRDPNPAGGEGNFVWSIADMEIFANRVWMGLVEA